MKVGLNGEKYKVVAVTPAGRREYLEILSTYIFRDMAAGIIDGWQLWINTDNAKDIAYMKQLAADNSKVRIYTRGGNQAYDPFLIAPFFDNAQDDNTIYVRFDDDIVFVDAKAVSNLLDCRIANPGPFVVFANTVNNSVCTHLHQKFGIISKVRGDVSMYKMDGLGWADGHFAEYVHDCFIAAGSAERFFIPDCHFGDYTNISINCFAFWGRDHLKPDPDEENWISERRPRETNRPNILCGSAVVSHYAFYIQRPYLDSRPHILDFYKKLVNR